MNGNIMMQISHKQGVTKLMIYWIRKQRTENPRISAAPYFYWILWVSTPSMLLHSTSQGKALSECIQLHQPYQLQPASGEKQPNNISSLPVQCSNKEVIPSGAPYEVIT